MLVKATPIAIDAITDALGMLYTCRKFVKVIKYYLWVGRRFATGLVEDCQYH